LSSLDFKGFQLEPKIPPHANHSCTFPLLREATGSLPLLTDISSSISRSQLISTSEIICHCQRIHNVSIFSILQRITPKLPAHNQYLGCNHTRRDHTRKARPSISTQTQANTESAGDSAPKAHRRRTKSALLPARPFPWSKGRIQPRKSSHMTGPSIFRF